MSNSDAFSPVVGLDEGSAPELEPPLVLPELRPAAPVEPPSTSARKRRGKKANAPPPVEVDLDRLPALGGVQDWFREAPAWLVSGIIHMLMLVTLGLIVVAHHEPLREFELSLGTGDDGGNDFQEGDADAPVSLDDPPLPAGEALEPSQLGGGDGTDNFAVEATGPVDPFGTGLGLAMSEGPSAPPIQLALQGRGSGMKQSLLRAYGGTSGTEKAVTEALRWLARHQQSNGLWSLSGPYADGTSGDNPDAATALALLAFQGAGYTPNTDRKDPFAPVVTRAWKAFLKRQDKDGNFFQQGPSHGRLYTQALCTIALCELYGMTDDSLYREPAQNALNYCVSVQSPEGGWRYQPGFDSDTSVTGWFVMALQSARMAGLDVPTESLSRVGKFLDTVAIDSGAKYSYTPGQGQRLSMTAEGLLCRQYLGWKHSDARLQRGIKELLQNVPENAEGKRESYYWYYASQVCHHMEGDAWRTWNAALREVVPATQIQDGRERGSWDPKLDAGIGASGGGRLFVTCLHTYMLEVYYRHLPLYQLEAMQASR